MGLEEARKKISEIDGKMLALLNERVELAVEIGSEKKSADEPVYDAAREAEVIARLLKENAGRLRKEDVELLFREIISVSRRAQQAISVAYLGPEGTFTHAAAMKHFGSGAKFRGCDTIREVFNSVERGEADFGVAPVENSLGGSVSHTYDLFINSELNIVAELEEQVNHNLLSRYRLMDIEKIYTHPAALAQCKEWIAKNLPNAGIIEVSSTAKGVEAAGLYINSAGIGSEAAAALYGLEIVAKNIQDNANNRTRFIVIGRAMPMRTAGVPYKTSIMFTTKNKPGALFDAFEPLKRHGVNMTKIESRPARLKNWEYVFFVDFEGFAGDAKADAALGEMRKNAGLLRVIGSYPEKSG